MEKSPGKTLKKSENHTKSSNSVASLWSALCTRLRAAGQRELADKASAWHGQDGARSVTDEKRGKIQNIKLQNSDRISVLDLTVDFLSSF